MNWFMSLEDARDKIERWRRDYNEFRPHSALTYLTPAEFAQKSGLEAVLKQKLTPYGKELMGLTTIQSI
jgi:transposase InsO family protein